MFGLLDVMASLCVMMVEILGAERLLLVDLVSTETVWEDMCMREMQCFLLHHYRVTRQCGFLMLNSLMVSAIFSAEIVWLRLSYRHFPAPFVGHIEMPRLLEHCLQNTFLCLTVYSFYGLFIGTGKCLVLFNLLGP